MFGVSLIGTVISSYCLKSIIKTIKFSTFGVYHSKNVKLVNINNCFVEEDK